MTSESPEQWLTREVGDLLEAGSVGLYELLWLLNGSNFQLVDANKKAIAYKVTNSIVSSRQAQLYELAWPSGEVMNGPADLATQITSPASWPEEASERYLALVRQ
jgi:hypothetical protein